MSAPDQDQDSLLCCDYKLIAKTISNGIKTVLAQLLEPTQTCGVPGHTQFDNLFLIRDVLSYCADKHVNGSLISIDQEKAFDKLNREFLFRVLDRMNFGPQISAWIKSLYTANIGHVLVNGYMSTSFDLTRGVKQGCPLSPLLFSLYIETLSLGIKSDPTIHGIPLPGNKHPVIMQYADDTTLFLSERTQMHNVFALLTRFERATGSTINHDKTKGLLLGKPKNVDSSSKQIQWKNDEGLKILGITFFPDYMLTQNYNWSTLIGKITTTLEHHSRRSLSLKGKVLILNTLALSKLWHIATVIPLPPWFEKRLNALLFTFLWGVHGYNPIKRNTIFQTRAKGGLGLKNPKLQQQALQLKYVQQIVTHNTSSAWLDLARYWLGFALAPLHPDWHFLRGNHLPTPADGIKPKYYADLLHTFTLFQPNEITWKTAYFYSILLNISSEVPTAYDRFWKNIATINLNDLWAHVYASYALGKHQDIHFKFLHRLTHEFRFSCSS